MQNGTSNSSENYIERLNEEARAFDRIVLERAGNGKIPDIQREFFNPYFYNNIWRNSVFVRQHYGASADWVITQLRIAKAESVIEFGCGDGWVCLELARAGFKVLGIDVSAVSISIAKQYLDSLPGKKHLDLHYHCQNAIEFLSNSQGVDSVVCHGFLHHLPQNALEEFISLVGLKMRQGNVFIGVEPCYDKIDRQAALLVYALRMALPNYFQYRGQIESEIRIVIDELSEKNKNQSALDNESPSEKILEEVRRRFKYVTVGHCNVFYDKVVGSLRLSPNDEKQISALLSALDDLIIKYSPQMGRRMRLCARNS